jgi:hypothetical protein
MKILAGIVGFALVLVVLLDAFETIILPRRVGYQRAPHRWRRALASARLN